MTTTSHPPTITARHFLALGQARAIGTATALLTEDAVDAAIAARAIILISGEAGLGKTFAVQRALARHSSTGEAPNLVEAIFTARPTMRHVADVLLTQATGVRHKGPRDKLTDALLEELRQPTVVFADEAQNLNAECMHYLRYLWDLPSSDLTLVLAGGNGCYKTISSDPMLSSRIYRHVRFARMTEAEALQILPRFHPIFETCPPERLLEVHQELTRGVFRSCAIVAHTAQSLARPEDHGHLTDTLLLRVRAAMGAGEP
jgi:AAA domain